MLEMDLNGFLNVNGVYDQLVYAFFGFLFYTGSGNSRWFSILNNKVECYYVI